MNHSEYLRRKMESMPKVYGPSRPGDASETTRIRGAIAAAAGRVRARPPTRPCCGPRSRTVVLPSGVVFYDSSPIRIGAGCGLSEDRSNARLVQIAAGCAIIGSGGCRPSTEIRVPCCPQESTPEVPRDALGNPIDPNDPIYGKANAYKGRQTCCVIQGPPLQDLDPAILNRCCRPPGYGDTATMTDVPLREMPIIPAERAACCPAPAPAASGECDANGYPL